jgi:hypothetical protein
MADTRIGILGVTLLLLAAGQVRAAPGESRDLLHVQAALPGPRGSIGFETCLGFFVINDLLFAGEEHTRFENTWHISWTPLRFVEATLSYATVVDQSTSDTRDVGMMSFGDPQLSLKAGHRVWSGLALGGLFRLLVPSDLGPGAPSWSATSLRLEALASWSFAPLPLTVLLNAGFFYDGSENLDLSGPALQQRFAADVSGYHRVPVRVGAAYHTAYVSPSIELSLEPMVGSGAPGVSQSPGWLSLGAHVRPARSDALTLFAGVDIGLTGVGDGGDQSTVLEQGGAVLPRWRLLAGLGYRFSPGEPKRAVEAPGAVETPAPRAAPEPEPRPKPRPKPQAVVGKVLDRSTGQPLVDARVRVLGSRSSLLAVDPSDGSFRTHPLRSGTHSLEASADRYAPQKLSIEVSAGRPARVVFRLGLASSSGVVRGQVRSLGGRGLGTASILIPEADRTVTVKPDGAFSVVLLPGRYTLVVSAPGYRPQKKPVRVRPSATVILNVDLHR